MRKECKKDGGWRDDGDDGDDRKYIWQRGKVDGERAGERVRESWKYSAAQCPFLLIQG
jgi:hypothetical protein